MRVWEKNFLFSLSLFIFVLFIFVFVMTSTSFSSALASVRETSLNEEYFISKAIISDITALESRDNANEQTLSSVIAPYGSYYQKRGVYLSLTSRAALFYNNAPFAAASTDFKNERVCEIISSGEDKYVRVTDALQGTNNEYALVYLKNINRTYQAQSRQTLFLIITSVCVSVLLAIGLYFTLKKIYRPIDNLAHELRTPLTSIRGYAEYLKLAATTEEERYSAADYIIEESRRLSDISDKLLIMANLREGDFECSKVDIKSLFENAKMTYKNIEYEVDQQYIKGDKTLLQSMINNLVANAVCASLPDQKVYIKAHDNVIQIKDSGTGMNADELSRAAKPYYRSNINKKSGGAGLGIPLCYQIARLHNANIRFESKPGEGTIVFITFTSP